MTYAEISKSPKTDEIKLEERRKLLLKLGIYSALVPALAACSVFKDDDDSPPPPSDRRLKEEVTRIGTTAHGLPYYSFRYIGANKLYAGVMAQDVLKVMPEAVSSDEAGYYHVDYKKLGTKMLLLQ